MPQCKNMSPGDLALVLALVLALILSCFRQPGYLRRGNTSLVKETFTSACSCSLLLMYKQFSSVKQIAMTLGAFTCQHSFQFVGTPQDINANPLSTQILLSWSAGVPALTCSSPIRREQHRRRHRCCKKNYIQLTGATDYAMWNTCNQEKH